MNEVQLLRRQIGTERAHAREARAIAAAAGTATQAMMGRNKNLNPSISNRYVKYIEYCMRMESTRALGHIARLATHSPLVAGEEAALARLRRTLEQHVPLDGTVGSVAQYVSLLCDLVDASEALERFTERRYSVEDWRAVAQVNADSVLEERKLWGEVIEHGPPASER